jgi:predicted glutamine amidotransferase
MCELFGMSSSFRATVNTSLERLAERGGDPGVNRDGWGIAFYDGGDIRLLRDTAPASGSPWVAFVEQLSLRSRIVLSHIRHATEGEVALQNTHPFARELGGRMHVFAHNGKLEHIRTCGKFPLRWHRPVGETDSEYAFCALLERLADLWLGAASEPTLGQRFETVCGFAADLRALGVGNFLYSDGEALFAHGHRRTHADGIRPPGLHVLHRRCPASREQDAAGVANTGPDRHVTLFASVPLSDEPWRPLEEGEVVMAVRGKTVGDHGPSSAVEAVGSLAVR